MIFVGVDPGKSGGFAVIGKTENGTTVDVKPWDDKAFAIRMSMLTLSGDSIVVAVEKVTSRTGQGVRSMFTFGKAAGYIEGVLTALDIPYQLVPPVKWKKEFSLIGQDKQASIDACKRLFPRLELKRTEKCTTDSDGMAESALLALYAMRHFGGML